MGVSWLVSKVQCLQEPSRNVIVRAELCELVTQVMECEV